jgi:hypothetical protein
MTADDSSANPRLAQATEPLSYGVEQSTQPNADFATFIEPEEASFHPQRLCLDLTANLYSFGTRMKTMTQIQL